MRQQFTEFWNSLGSNLKSVIISIGAIVLSTALLLASKAVFPSHDFSPAELIIVTGINGFIASLIKNLVKLGK